MLITQIHPSYQHQQKSISKTNAENWEEKRSNYRWFAKPDWETKKEQKLSINLGKMLIPPFKLNFFYHDDVSHVCPDKKEGD